MEKSIPAIPKNNAMFQQPATANVLPYWGFFAQREIQENKGKLLMMDIDFGRHCSRNCPTCFRKINILDDAPEDDLAFEQLNSSLIAAKEMGLVSVKICGAGEPFENGRFFEFLQRMSVENIGVAIFTKGHVLGDDRLIERHFGHLGFKNALDFCKELRKLKTTIMLSFQSFYPEIQDFLVGGIAGHTLVRNKALENLVAAGFNQGIPTRLALCSNPITKQNYPEIFDIYKFARERNIYPVTAVLMTSGKQIGRGFLMENDINAEQKLSLWTRIYSYNINRGLQTLKQIQEEGVSVLPGVHPCNQVAVGLYLTANGNVTICPGYNFTIGNIKHESLKVLWQKTQGVWNEIAGNKYGGQFNCHCPPKDGNSIPLNLYAEVLRRLERKFSNP